MQKVRVVRANVQSAEIFLWSKLGVSEEFLEEVGL